MTFIRLTDSREGSPIYINTDHILGVQQFRDVTRTYCRERDFTVTEYAEDILGASPVEGAA